MKQSGLEVFEALVRIIKQPGNYKPRGYQSIGGMWTVDTWIKDSFTYRVMDEGWSCEIIFDNKKVHVYLGISATLNYDNCTEQEFVNFAKGIIDMETEE